MLNLYFELCREDFTSSHLDELERKIIPDALNAAYSIFGVRQILRGSSKHFRGVKLHVLLHFPALIRRFGHPKIWDTDTYESAHKEKVKLLFKMGSKRISNVEQEALSRVREFAKPPAPHSNVICAVYSLTESRTLHLSRRRSRHPIQI